MIKKVMEDYKVLLRSIPAATVSLFFVSVIMMNLLANKELISREPVLLGMLAHARYVGRLLRHRHDRGQHRP